MKKVTGLQRGVGVLGVMLDRILHLQARTEWHFGEEDDAALYDPSRVSKTCGIVTGLIKAVNHSFVSRLNSRDIK